MTTFFAERILEGAQELGEDAAHHARVKRLASGAEISVTDGKGRRATGRITSLGKTTLAVNLDVVTFMDPPAEIHLFIPVADRDRMLWVAEKATELQVATWNPVMYERSRSVSPRGEGESFDRKVKARMIGALEQSGGAWLPTIHPVRTPDELAAVGGIVLERGANPFGRGMVPSPCTLAVGPEGGFTPRELGQLLGAGWTAASFGDVTLRFETAAIGAVAIARSMLS